MLKQATQIQCHLLPEEFVEIDRERLLTLCEFAKWLNFQHDDAYKRYWVYAEERFENTFGCLCFNDPCSVCDRLWSDTQLKSVHMSHYPVLRRHFPDEAVENFQVCSNCYARLNANMIPQTP